MTIKEAIEWLKSIDKKYIHGGDEWYDAQRHEAISLAIKALERDSKVDDITFHWNDDKNNFVAACIAFEDILKVYGRGIEE